MASAPTEPKYMERCNILLHKVFQIINISTSTLSGIVCCISRIWEKMCSFWKIFKTEPILSCRETSNNHFFFLSFSGHSSDQWILLLISNKKILHVGGEKTRSQRWKVFYCMGLTWTIAVCPNTEFKIRCPFSTTHFLRWQPLFTGAILLKFYTAQNSS